MYECDICEELFSTCKRRKRHRKRIHAHLECLCRRNFVYEHEMKLHKRVMSKNAKAYPCAYCCLSFETAEGIQKHARRYKHRSPIYMECDGDDDDDDDDDDYQEPRFYDGTSTLTQPYVNKSRRRRKKIYHTGNHVCPTCSNTFAKENSLLQHQHSKGHLIQSTESRKNYFDDFYERNVKVDKEDMTASRKIVDTLLNRMMRHVREQPGGYIFNPNVIKAGSAPVNAKIGKADEFDTNIELNVTDTEIRSRGQLKYDYVDNEDTASFVSSMKVIRELEESSEGIPIPSGFAVVKVDDNGSVPDTYIFGRDIIPRLVKQDLFNKMQTAINELAVMHVDLSPKAHGPALTMTIHPKQSGVKHDIDVDISPSLKSDFPITKNGWPRSETIAAFGKELIDKVIQTGTHLVPKKDLFWAISNSKAERTILKNIDEGDGCRKKIYKVMKKYVKNYKSKSQEGLSGISSHILKTQVFWSIEKHASKEYWHNSNRDICLIDTLRDMETTLRKSHLPDFFNPRLNVLDEKDRGHLLILANYFKNERIAFESK